MLLVIALLALCAVAHSQQTVQVYTASTFGAKGDYSTDDTAAIQTAINSVCGTPNSGPTELLLNNNRIAGALDFTICATNRIYLTVHVRNRISLGTGLLKPSGIALNGSGSVGVQFQKGSVGLITCDAGATFSGKLGCLFLSGSGAHDIRNIAVAGSNGPEIYSLPGTQLLKFYNVGSSSTQGVSTSIPMLLDGTEWLECEHCAFDSGPYSAPYSVRITNSDAALDFSGLVRFTDSALSGPGIQIDSQVAVGNGVMNLSLENVIHENTNTALVNIDGTNEYTHGLHLVDSVPSDEAGTTLTADVDSVTTAIPVTDGEQFPLFPLPFTLEKELLNCTAFTPAVGHAGNLTCTRGTSPAAHVSGTLMRAQPPLIHVIAHAEKISNATLDFVAVSPPDNYVAADASITGLKINGDFGFLYAGPNKARQNQRKYIQFGSGMIDAELANDGSVPLFATPFASSAVVQDQSVWTVDGGGTITRAVSDPRGGNGAATLTANTCSDSPMINVGASVGTINVGDWVIVGMRMRAENPNNTVFPQALGITGSGSMFDNGSTQLPIANMGTLNIGGQVWMRATAIGKVAVAATGAAYNFFLGADCDRPTSFYKPWLITIPAGSISDEQAVYFARTLTDYPSGLASPSGPRVSMYNETSIGWGSDTYMTRVAAGVVAIPTVQSAYKSADGTAGITGSTCTSWKNGLCVAQ